MRTARIRNHGRYSISECGVVVRDDGYVVKQQLMPGTGYMTLRLLVDDQKKAKTLTIHRLLALAFIPNPFGYPVVRHLDGNKLNNSLNNLAWGTVRDNAADAIRHGATARGSKHPNHKLSEEDVSVLRLLVGFGWNYKSIGERLGVGESCVGVIARRRNWGWL